MIEILTLESTHIFIFQSIYKLIIGIRKELIYLFAYKVHLITVITLCTLYVFKIFELTCTLVLITTQLEIFRELSLLEDY